MGNSKTHSHGIPLVLSLDTGKITAQYHVVFDDWFHTVHSSVHNQINFEHNNWYKTFGLTEWQYIPDDYDEISPDQVDTNHPSIESEGVNQQEQARTIRDQLHAPPPLSPPAIERVSTHLPQPLQRETEPPVRELPALTVPDSIKPTVPPSPVRQQLDSPQPDTVPAESSQREKSHDKRLDKPIPAPTPKPRPAPVAHRPVTRSQTRAQPQANSALLMAYFIKASETM